MEKKYYLTHGRGWLRVLALILLLCITAATAFAAGRRNMKQTLDDDTNGDLKPPEMSQIIIDGDNNGVGSVDLGGATFKILVSEQERNTSFRKEDTAPTVLSRVDAQEGQALAKELNVQLRAVRLSSPESYVNTAYAAGESDTADLLVLTVAPEGVGLMSVGRLADLTLFPTLNLDKDIFDRVLTDSLAVCGERFLLFGKGTLGMDDSLTVMAFEKGAPVDVTELYGLVTDGKWTLDALAVLARQLDTSEGVQALPSGTGEAVSWWLAAGGTDAAGKEDGFTVTLGSADGRHALALLKKTIYGDLSDTDTAGTEKTVFSLTSLAGYAASDPEKTGLLPLPKASESGTYLSYVSPEKATGFAVTSFCDEPERSALIAYYLTDRTAKLFAGENGRDVCGSDENSLAAMRLITRNRRISVLSSFGFGEVLRATLSDLVEEEENFSELLSRRSVLMQFSIDASVQAMQAELANLVLDAIRQEQLNYASKPTEEVTAENTTANE